MIASSAGFTLHYSLFYVKMPRASVENLRSSRLRPPSALLTSMLTACIFVLLLTPAHAKEVHSTSPHQRLYLSGIVFSSQKKWAFWLNGTLIDSSGEGQSTLRAQGLRVRKVDKNQVLLEKGTQIIILKLCRHGSISSAPASLHRPQLSKTVHAPKSTGLGFSQ